MTTDNSHEYKIHLSSSDNVIRWLVLEKKINTYHFQRNAEDVDLVVNKLHLYNLQGCHSTYLLLFGLLYLMIDLFVMHCCHFNHILCFSKTLSSILKNKEFTDMYQHFSWHRSAESASLSQSVQIHTDSLSLTWTDVLLFTNLLTSLLCKCVYVPYKSVCVCVCPLQ